MFPSIKDTYIFNIAQINFPFVDAIFILTFPHEYTSLQNEVKRKSDVHLILIFTIPRAIVLCNKFCYKLALPTKSSFKA